MVDRQTERTPGILIKRNPNPQPVLELNPALCSDSRFKGGMDRVLLNFQTISSFLHFNIVWIISINIILHTRSLK